MQDNNQERFPIVDEEGRVVGTATRGECHNGSKLLHPVVHLHVFNSRGEVYLQKRPEWKDIQPGKWDTSVGGHIDYGETPEQALNREVMCLKAVVNGNLSMCTVLPTMVLSVRQLKNLMEGDSGQWMRFVQP